MQAQGGFDSSQSNLALADIQAWIQERYRQAVAQARYRMVELAVGSTVAGQFLYVLDTGVVEVEGLTVNGVPYEQAGTKQLWDLRNGRLQLSRGSAGGVFGQDYLADGTVELSIYPTPTVAGSAIVGLCSVEPVPLDSGSNATPIIPADLHEAVLVFGPIATGFSTVEERLDSANYFEGLFGAAVKELGRRRKGRVNGGPVQIQVQGYHFR